MLEQNMDQHSSDAASGVEQALSALWEKAREASLLISTLREERKRLQLKIAELEEEIVHTKSALLQQQSRVDQLTAEGAEQQSKNVTALDVTAEERRALQIRLRTIIAKLDQYIAS